MFKPSFQAISRIFIILVGMIKAGYSLMIFQNFLFLIYSDESIQFYKYMATFFAGSTLTLSLCNNWSRNIILLFAEFLYLLMMIIIPFSSNDFRIYGFLFSGGFCFLLYPLYFKENLLIADHKKSTIVAWIFMGMGTIYYFWLAYHYYSCYEYQTIIENFSYIQIHSDKITPYVFGSFSVLNILLILLQKGKETIFFYKQKQDTEKIFELSYLLYNNSYCDKIKQECDNNDIEIANSYLLSESNNNNNNNSELNKKKKQKLLILIFATAFLIGSQAPFSALIDSFRNFLLFIKDHNESTLEITFGNCFSYQFIILISVLLGIYLISRQRKGFLFVFLAIVLITRFIIFGFYYTDILSDFQADTLNLVFLINFIFNFGGLGSMIFTQPFLVLKIHEILLYFIFFWIGNTAQYLFMYNSIPQSEYLKLKYSPQILSIITLIISILPLKYLKTI